MKSRPAGNSWSFCFRLLVPGLQECATMSVFMALQMGSVSSSKFCDEFSFSSYYRFLLSLKNKEIPRKGNLRLVYLVSQTTSSIWEKKPVQPKQASVVDIMRLRTETSWSWETRQPSAPWTAQATASSEQISGWFMGRGVSLPHLYNSTQEGQAWQTSVSGKSPPVSGRCELRQGSWGSKHC